MKTGTNAALSAASANSAAHEVRDLEGDRERRERRRWCRSSSTATISRTSPAIRDRPGRDREDRGVAGDAPARRGARRRRRLGSCRVVAGWARSTRPEATAGGRGAALSQGRGAGPLHCPAAHGQHSFPEEAHPPLRARAPREPPLHVDDQDLLPPPRGRGRRRRRRRPPTPSTRRWSRRSTRPSSAARCTATPARARSPAPRASARGAAPALAAVAGARAPLGRDRVDRQQRAPCPRRARCRRAWRARGRPAPRAPPQRVDVASPRASLMRRSAAYGLIRSAALICARRLARLEPRGDREHVAQRGAPSSGTSRGSVSPCARSSR